MSARPGPERGTRKAYGLDGFNRTLVRVFFDRHVRFVAVPMLTFGLQGVLRHLRLRHVDNAVDVERDLLRVRRPALVAKAVRIFPIGERGE